MPPDYGSISIYSQDSGATSTSKCHGNIACWRILFLIKVFSFFLVAWHHFRSIAVKSFALQCVYFQG